MYKLQLFNMFRVYIRVAKKPNNKGKIIYTKQLRPHPGRDFLSLK